MDVDMSLKIEKFIICDGCGHIFEDDTFDKAFELRKNAKNKGWVSSKGKDYCPKCHSLWIVEKND
jgi:hypothetical protein